MSSPNFLQNIRMGSIYQVPRMYEDLTGGGNTPNLRGGSYPASPGETTYHSPNQVANIGNSMQQGQPNVVLGDQGFQGGTAILENSFGRDTPGYELANKKLDETTGLKEAALKEKGTEAAGNLAVKQGQLAVNQQRQSVYAFKAQNDKDVVIVGKDGITRAINPITGSVKELGKTGMSDTEAAALNQRYAIERIGTRGANQKDIEAAHEKSAMEIEKSREASAQAIEGSKEATHTSGAELPSQKLKDVQLKYNQLTNEHPEYRDFITRDSTTGEVKVTPPGGGGIFSKAPTQEQFDTINKYLYGGSSGSTNTNVKMKSGNREFNIPQDKLEQFKKDFPDAIEAK